MEYIRMYYMGSSLIKGYLHSWQSSKVCFEDSFRRLECWIWFLQDDFKITSVSKRHKFLKFCTFYRILFGLHVLLHRPATLKAVSYSCRCPNKLHLAVPLFHFNCIKISFLFMLLHCGITSPFIWLQLTLLLLSKKYCLLLKCVFLPNYYRSVT